MYLAITAYGVDFMLLDLISFFILQVSLCRRDARLLGSLTLADHNVNLTKFHELLPKSHPLFYSIANV